MKVLLWTQYFWPEHFHINEVALSLHEAGEAVTVLTGKPNYPSGVIFKGYSALGIQKEAHGGIDVVRLPLRPRGPSKARDLTLNYLSFITSGYLFSRLALKRKRFDIVFVYAPSPLLQALPAIFFARSRGIPLVLWVQDLWPEALVSTGFLHNKLILGVIERLVRYIYRQADLLLIPSEAFRAPVKRLGGDPEKICFHPNSSKPAAVLPALKEGTQCLVKDIQQQFSIVYAGNIGTVQSLNTVVAAATLLQEEKDIRFYLIGNGTMMTAIENEIRHRGLSNVRMHGWVSADEIFAVYQAASVLLVSLKDDAQICQTIPNKLQVYMAAGKPIIVSGNGEASRVLQQANAGLACPAGDERALADTVISMRNMHPGQLDQFGKNGKEWFLQNFELNSQTKFLVEHMERVIRYKRRKTSISRNKLEES